MKTPFSMFSLQLSDRACTIYRLTAIVAFLGAGWSFVFSTGSGPAYVGLGAAFLAMSIAGRSRPSANG